MERETVYLRMEPELKERVEIVAQASGESMNQVMVQAIREFIKKALADKERRKKIEAMAKRYQGVLDDLKNL